MAHRPRHREDVPASLGQLLDSTSPVAAVACGGRSAATRRIPLILWGASRAQRTALEMTKPRDSAVPRARRAQRNQ